MKEIVILSGKGGTGKTTVTAALASLLGPPLVLVDADVEVSNLPLLLAPRLEREDYFRAGWEPVRDEERCSGCGICLEKCRFGAIRKDLRVDHWACEGCGVCAWFCPEEAIEMREKEVGRICLSQTRYGPLVHAELFPGEENSGKLVAEVKRRGRCLAEKKGLPLLLVDGAPGIGCPVMASLSGADLVLMVVEPTLSALHDLERLGRLLKHFDLSGYIILNKADLEPDLASFLRERAGEWAFLGEIPYDEEVFYALQEARPLPEVSQGKASRALKEIAASLKNVLKEG